MRLLDSNIVIAAAVPEADGLRADLSTEPCVISIVTRIEVLGFHRLTAEEESGLREFRTGKYGVKPTRHIAIFR